MSEPTLPSNGAYAPTGDRAVLSMLERIERRLGHLEMNIERAAAIERQLPAALATAVDSLDSLAGTLAERGIDIDQRLRVVLDVAERLTAPEALKAVTTLLDRLALIQHVLESEILAESSVDVVGKAGQALAAARIEETPQIGLWGAARAMSDDDVKRAVGFLLRVAKLFGRSLATGADARLLPAGEAA